MRAVATWEPLRRAARTRSRSRPSRILLQDFTGVPAVVDLAAMRDAIAELGGDPARINPSIPAELVIDHSVQVDVFASSSRIRAATSSSSSSATASATRSCAGASARFADFKVVPPGTGICHQVNLEYPRARGRGPRRRRVPGHGRRHRLAHDDGQRARRARLGRRRDRGRGGDARRAALDARAAGRRLPTARAVARGRDRDRPRPDGDRAARARRASSASSSSTSATGSRDCRSPTARRSGTCRPSTARRAASSRSTS